MQVIFAEFTLTDGVKRFNLLDGVGLLTASRLILLLFFKDALAAFSICARTCCNRVDIVFMIILAMRLKKDGCYRVTYV